MSSFALMVHLGPGDQEPSRLADLLDSLFSFEPETPWVIVIDDRGTHAPPTISVPATCRVLTIPNPKQLSKHPHEGGLCVGDVAGFLAFVTQTDARMLVKVDTDSLIIGAFSRALDAYFAGHPGVGMAGSLGPSCDPAAPLFRATRPARATLVLMYRIVERLRQQFAEPPAHSMLIKNEYADIHLEPEQLKAAYRLYDLIARVQPWSAVGEFLHGGGYAIPRHALRTMQDLGFFDTPLIWRDMKLGEDLFASLMVQAAGYALADLSGEDEPFAVQQYGLAFPPAELAKRGHCVIHSVKNGPDFSESAVREWFRLRRPRDTNSTVCDPQQRHLAASVVSGNTGRFQTRKKIAVAVNVHAEPIAQISVCMRKIAANMPGAGVRVFVNGTVRRDVIALAGELGFEVNTGANLATNATWHLWWRRMLEFFCESGAHVCLKFDPDTMVDAAPVAIPESEYFGCLQRGTRTFVQGGVTGLSGRSAGLLITEKALEPNAGNRWWLLSPTDGPFMDDQLIAGALARVGVVPTYWPECRSQWRCPVLNNPVTHAIVHPRYYGLGNAAVGEEFLGTWCGSSMGGESCRIVLEVSNSEGEAMAVVRLNQGVHHGMAADSIQQHGRSLVMFINTWSAALHVEADEDGSVLHGHWKRQGVRLPLRLTKAHGRVDSTGYSRDGERTLVPAAQRA